jgi:hypothetical protein
MAMKPKKIISNRGEVGVGGSARGGSRLSNTFGRAPKVEAKKPPKKVAASPKAPIKIKSGGNIKPATPKKTIASNPARVGNAPSPSRVKWDLETAKLMAKKGKTVKINSAKK